jgi:homoserine dehydrogenase
MNIAILGFGTVGKGVYEIIKNNGLTFLNVTKIYRRKGSKMTLPIETDDIDSILNDDSIETIVECMGGLEPAYDFVTEAMKKGKNVVTANKMLVATFYDELINLSDDHDVYFLFEASVGGGVPWIENLSRVGFVDDVKGFKGILNGSTNYILDRMTNEGLEFDEALTQVQELGYAEKDPSSDIDGDDVLYKTIISANVASKKSFSMEGVLKYGIRNILKKDIDYFKEHDFVCKLIAEYDRDTNAIMVMPELFGKEQSISNVALNFNYVELYCNSSGKLSFEGQGAGKFPTGFSIVEDLIRIEQHAVVPMLTTEKVHVKYEKFDNKFYVRYKDDKVEILDGMTESEIRNDNIAFIAKIN